MMTDKDFERFMSKVQKCTATGCWLWTGSLLKGGGYGQFGMNPAEGGARRTYIAHRLLYRHMVGEVPDGKELHHLCETKRCVNPAHMRVCTRQENMRTGKWGEAVAPYCGRRQRSKTLCPQGHALVEPNLIHNRKLGTKQCKICMRTRQREYMRRKRARTAAKPA